MWSKTAAWFFAKAMAWRIWSNKRSGRAGYDFRIGSVTKQFTAVVDLMLPPNRASLASMSEIKKVPARISDAGKQDITVEHLLTHTSGIKSYTGLPELRSLWRNEMSRGERI